MSTRLPKRLAPLSALLAFVLTGLVTAAWLAANPNEAKNPEEKWDEPRRERSETEEHDPMAGKYKAIRVEEARQPKPRADTGPTLETDLGTAAAQEAHPEIRALFLSLAVPHDVVTVIYGKLRDDPPTLDGITPPLAEYLADEPNKRRTVFEVTFTYKEDTWKAKMLLQTRVEKIRHYEQLALEAARALQGKKLAGVPEPRKFLAAEHILVAALRFHDSAREKKLRNDDPRWTRLRDELRKEIQKTALGRLEASAATESWETLLALARQFAERFPEEDTRAVTRPLVSAIQTRMKDSGETGLKTARQQLEALQAVFPRADAEEVARVLQEAAEKLARQADDEKEPAEAARLRQRALDIWPRLASQRSLGGLRGGVLHVGVRDMPAYFSPALAFHDAETQALDLLFEGLVELELRQGGFGYRSVLAHGKPRLRPLGRQFVLTPGARWSDGSPVTAYDVRETIGLLRRRWVGRVPSWAGLVLPPTLRGGDEMQIEISLTRGYVDPLGLMTFKILPMEARRDYTPPRTPDEEHFAKNPLGSGPFLLNKRDSSDEAVTFEANPFYAQRPRNNGLPGLRKIIFQPAPRPKDSDPAALDTFVQQVTRDMNMNRLHVLLDLPSAEAAALQKQLGKEQVLSLPARDSRRIYFLAVNHSRPNLGLAEVRRALTLAIPREEILKKHFALGEQPGGLPLNGPYPAGSWACSDKIKPDLFDPVGAKAALSEVAAKTGGGLSFKLHYPAGDPRVKAAMQAIREAFKEHLKVELDLRAVSPRELRAAVLPGGRSPDYDLAYFWYDYPDLTFQALPLFDPSEGGNFLHYRPSASVQEQLRQPLQHRDFERLRSATHTLHGVLNREMPLIPLWQLDYHLAVHPKLELPREPLDPLRIFARAALWKLKDG